MVDNGGDYLLHISVALRLSSSRAGFILVSPILGVDAPLDKREVEVTLNALIIAVGHSEQGRLNADDLFDYGVSLVYLLLALLLAYLSEIRMAP